MCMCMCDLELAMNKFNMHMDKMHHVSKTKYLIGPNFVYPNFRWPKIFVGPNFCRLKICQ